MAAFGNDGLRMTFGRADFLGVGISFCLTITVPLILIAYLCGGNLFVLVTIYQYKHYLLEGKAYDSPDQLLILVVSIIRVAIILAMGIKLH